MRPHSRKNRRNGHGCSGHAPTELCSLSTKQMARTHDCAGLGPKPGSSILPVAGLRACGRRRKAPSFSHPRVAYLKVAVPKRPRRCGLRVCVLFAAPCSRPERGPCRRKRRTANASHPGRAGVLSPVFLDRFIRVGVALLRWRSQALVSTAVSTLARFPQRDGEALSRRQSRGLIPMSVPAPSSGRPRTFSRVTPSPGTPAPHA